MGVLTDFLGSSPSEEKLAELVAELEEVGLRYDFVVASSVNLADLVDSEGVRKYFMDALVSRLQKGPVTKMQRELVHEIASSIIDEHV